MIMEVAIAVKNEFDGNRERKKEGDIIAVRPNNTGIGTKEAKEYLWLRLEGLFERADFDNLSEAVFEIDETPQNKFDKRRYSIPLHKLQQFDPSFDVARARDPADFYQPFLVTDAEDYTFITTKPPFDVRGLVFDKAIGDYL